MPYLISYTEGAEPGSKVWYMQDINATGLGYRTRSREHATSFPRAKDAQCWLERLIQKHNWEDLRVYFTVCKDTP